MQNCGDSDRDHVRLLDFYISKFPTDMVENNEYFYFRPLPTVPNMKDAPSLSRQCIGRQKLMSMVKTTQFKATKIDGNFTNHSLRAIGATAFFNAGVPVAVRKEQGTSHLKL